MAIDKQQKILKSVIMICKSWKRWYTAWVLYQYYEPITQYNVTGVVVVKPSVKPISPATGT